MDLPGVRTLLAQAFVDDPMLQWIFPEEFIRLEATAAWFGIFVERYAAIDRVMTLDDGAVMLWRMPDDPREPPATLPTVGGLLAALVGLERAGAIGDALGVIAEITPSEPHVYVNFLGVDPSRQGRGLGLRLLRPVVAAARDAGLGVHLETTNPRNVGFYERMGFIQTGEGRLGADGPLMRAMLLPMH